MTRTESGKPGTVKDGHELNTVFGKSVKDRLGVIVYLHCGPVTYERPQIDHVRAERMTDLNLRSASSMPRKRRLFFLQHRGLHTSLVSEDVKNPL
jgi:hypothetical protein